MDLLDLLKQRNLVEQISDRLALQKKLKRKNSPITVYAGIDPTADSLHLGNLLVLRTLRIFQKQGHKVILLFGGGTGLVGDPTDKEAARVKMRERDVQTNLNKLKKQIKTLKLLDFNKKNSAIIVNNQEWLSKKYFLKDFISSIAPLFSVNQMIKFKTFSKRIKENKNLSLLEFMYPVLQAWDFLNLFEKHNCQLQLGGNDQWTNMIEGVELIKKKYDQQVFIMTLPLLVDAEGEKIGKSTSGQIWLDKEKTSPFVMYQALEKTPDKLVEQMLKQFTDLSLDKIASIMKLAPRERQQILAFEIISFVHGKKEADKAKQDSKQLFGKIKGKIETIPSVTVSNKGVLLDDLLIKNNVVSSKSEVRRRCDSGGIYINDVKIKNPKFLINKQCTIKAGKRDFLKVNLKS